MSSCSAGAETTAAATTSEEKEGINLLGSPTFVDLHNGRLKCVETGHELLPKDKDSYTHSKRCRLGLIDYALSHKKSPLNLFKQDPLTKSKVICKLTGDTINKTEEHIWKHLNGKRFLNKLEQKETEKAKPNGKADEMKEESPQNGVKEKNKQKKKKKKNKNKNKKEKKVDEIFSEVREPSDKDSESEEPDFWMPQVGDRWDNDDGGDRWGSGSESEQEVDESDEINGAAEDDSKESEELSVRTKRMSIEIGPSSFASRKKKPKKTT